MWVLVLSRAPPHAPDPLAHWGGGQRDKEKVPCGRPLLSFDTLESNVMVDGEKPGEGFPGASQPQLKSSSAHRSCWASTPLLSLHLPSHEANLRLY